MIAAFVDLVQAGVGGVLVALGLALMAGGMLGLLRFPDFYTRLHAARVGDVVGAVVLLAGLAVLSDNGAITLRLLMLAGLIAALGPTLSHLAANAGHAGGLAPLSGRYTAPRPGAKRESPHE